MSRCTASPFSTARSQQRSLRLESLENRKLKAGDVIFGPPQEEAPAPAEEAPAADPEPAAPGSAKSIKPGSRQSLKAGSAQSLKPGSATGANVGDEGGAEAAETPAGRSSCLDSSLKYIIIKLLFETDWMNELIPIFEKNKLFAENARLKK